MLRDAGSLPAWSMWEPRPGGRECAFVYDTTVVARVPAGAGREDVTVVGVIERESGCQPVDRGWPEYALTDLDDRPLGRCATVDGLFDTPEPQPRPWRLLGAQPSGPLAVALDRLAADGEPVPVGWADLQIKNKGGAFSTGAKGCIFNRP
jgi:hypothetical protein